MRSQILKAEIYIGENYIVELEAWRNQRLYGFSIVAIHKQTKRCSAINTLNTILSWFGIDENSPLSSEPEWFITKHKLNQYRELAKNIFSDKRYFKYLETKLDEDRSDGEWANLRD